MLTPFGGALPIFPTSGDWVGLERLVETLHHRGRPFGAESEVARINREGPGRECAIWEYCRQDTLWLVELLRKL
jgi:hypothetical protein